MSSLEAVELPPAEIIAHEVGDRVIYTALFPNPGNYMDGEKMSGTVIAAFVNGRRMTYRVELDRVWTRSEGYFLGKKIVVGNVWADRLRRIEE